MKTEPKQATIVRAARHTVELHSVPGGRILYTGFGALGAGTDKCKRYAEQHGIEIVQTEIVENRPQQ